MQNKPNLRKAKMNVNSFITKDYRKKDDFAVPENKAKTNPICQRVKLMQSVYLQRIMKKNADKGYEKTKPKQTQFPKSQNERKFCFNKGLWKKWHFRSPGKQSQFKANQSRSEFTPKGADIPTGELLGILKPGTNFKGKKTPKPGYFALILTHFTEQSISNTSS